MRVSNASEPFKKSGRKKEKSAILRTLITNRERNVKSIEVHV